MSHEIAVSPGDGIRQEVTPAAVAVLEAVESVDFEFVEGIWNTTALMKANRYAIEETAAQLPYLDQTRSELESDD